MLHNVFLEQNQQFFFKQNMESVMSSTVIQSIFIAISVISIFLTVTIHLSCKHVYNWGNIKKIGFHINLWQNYFVKDYLKGQRKANLIFLICFIVGIISIISAAFIYIQNL